MSAKFERIKEFLAESYPESLLFGKDFKTALVGWTHEGRAVYDRNKCIESLIADGLSHEEAEDHFCYNVERNLAYTGKHGPVILVLDLEDV